MTRAPLLLLAALALLIGLSVGHCTGKSAEREDANIRIAAANGARLADAVRFKRDSAAAVAIERERITARERAAAARIDARLNATNTALVSARALIADSLATVVTLRASLASLVVIVDTLTRSVSDYRHIVDSTAVTHARERALLMSALTYSDSSGQAWKRAYEARTKRARCRVLFVPCPSRTQSFLLGAATVAALVVAVK